MLYVFFYFMISFLLLLFVRFGEKKEFSAQDFLSSKSQSQDFLHKKTKETLFFFFFFKAQIFTKTLL